MGVQAFYVAVTGFKFKSEWREYISPFILNPSLAFHWPHLPHPSSAQPDPHLLPHIQ